MTKAMQQDGDWPGMEEDIQRYIEGCQECQKNKPDRRKRNAPLNPLPIALYPWERISVDLIGPLPESMGYNAIMVIVDYFTKMKVFIPTTIELTSLGAAELFRLHALKHFGIPKGVISDRGPQFVSEFIKELWKLLGIKGLPSTAYHPQTDGQTERVNQELEIYLRFYVNYQQDDWVKWLDQAEFVQNTRFHEAIQNTPFFLMHGYNPWTGIEDGESEKSPGASEWKRELWKARENARRAMEKAADSMKRFYDRKHKYPREYLKGQRVWLDARNLKTFRPSKKLDQKKLGPFTIIDKIGKGAYRLQLPKSWTRIHPVFNKVLLTPVEEPQFIQQKEPEPPGPIDMEGEVEYEIEEVLSSRKRG